MPTEILRPVEHEWMEWIRKLPNWQPALQVFVRNYHYFSVNQVVAFSRLFAAIPRTDRKSLALLAEVLFEELGGGNPSTVHSVVFERFARATGVDVDGLPLPPSAVLNGVRWYVCELELAFGGTSLARALATYCFLEPVAVLTYPPLLETLRSFGFSNDDLDFFIRHSQIEVEHSKAANELVKRMNLNRDQQADFDDQTRLLEKCWKLFWSDIWGACREVSK